MTNPTQIAVQHALMQAQTSLRRASSLVARAANLHDVVQQKQVQAPGWLRPLLAREANALQREAERRAGIIVNDVLDKIAALSGTERQQAVARARQDFQALRGHFPRLSSQAEQALQQLPDDHGQPIDAHPAASLRQRG